MCFYVSSLYDDTFACMSTLLSASVLKTATVICTLMWLYVNAFLSTVQKSGLHFLDLLLLSLSRC